MPEASLSAPAATIGLAGDAALPLTWRLQRAADRTSHGSSAVSTVPPPGGLTTTRRPPSAPTRSASPRSPEPTTPSAPPIPSSVTVIASVASARADGDGDVRGLGVLACVGERLAGHEVRGQLDRARQPLVELDRERDAHRRPRRQTLQSDRQAVLERGGVDAAGQLPQLRERGREILPGRGDELGGRVGILADALLGQPQRHRDRHQPLLRTVVQVALDLPAGGVAGLRRSAPASRRARRRRRRRR